MSKRETRRLRDRHTRRRAVRPTRAAAAVRSADPETRESGSPRDRLARLLDSPLLARVVPHLAPETLHGLIRYRGLEACGEIVAAATPDQLTSLFDLDLWRNPQPGRDERFDEDRFGEWLEVLIESGDATAARIIAALDESLVITGLSRYLHVIDPGTLEPTAQSDDEPLDAYTARLNGSACEVGGYLVHARRPDAWDAIIALLLALEADHRDCFHAVMQGCRRLSNSAPEIDGLDDLLMAPDQQLHDVAIEREQRRSRQGYATPADARAFLQMARQPRRGRQGAAPSINPIAAAYFQAVDEVVPTLHARTHTRALESSMPSDVSESVDAVVQLLTEAGLVSEAPRALLVGTGPRSMMRMQELMTHLGETDPTVSFTRTRELAFLANVLLSGCSIQSRPFTEREAADAATAICNLGLEHWPSHWPVGEGDVAASTVDPGSTVAETFLVNHDLMTAFEVGWSVLHHDVSMFVANRLIAILMDLRCVDTEIQSGLQRLRRELVDQRDAGTPWRAREALDVFAMLDMPARAAILGLLDECPILPAALTAILEGHTRAVSATAFEFISTAEQIRDIRAFMDRLPDILLG
jgi:hypothetical protein